MKKGTIAGIVAGVAVVALGYTGYKYLSPVAADGTSSLKPGDIDIRNSSSSDGTKSSYWLVGGSRRKKQGPKKRQNKKTKRS